MLNPSADSNIRIYSNLKFEINMTQINGERIAINENELSTFLLYTSKYNIKEANTPQKNKQVMYKTLPSS